MSSSSYSGTSYVTCFCGETAAVRTSTTSDNPGRRFYGCKKYGHGDHCEFFDWVDKKRTASTQEKEMYKMMNNLRVANEDLRTLNQSVREINGHLRVTIATERRLRFEIERKYEKSKEELKNLKKWCAITMPILILCLIIVWLK